MPGLQFEQLPMSPEQTMQKDIQTGRQKIQDKFNLQWQTINNNARFLGREKHQAMLRQLESSARQDMLEFNQKAEQHMAQFNRIKQVSDAGGISPEIRQTYGDAIADAMYPKTQSVPQMFGVLDAYENKLAGDLDQFRMKKERVPSALLRGSKEGMAPGKVQVWDVGSPGKMNKETKKMEYWRDATPEETRTRTLLVREQGRIKKAKNELLGQPDVSRRLVQPGTRGGTLGDKIKKSYGGTVKDSDPLGLF